MPDNNKLVDLGYPTLPFFINDHGQDALFSITVVSGTFVLSGGSVLGRIAASGKYTRYNDGASDGTEVARGILFNRVDPRDGDSLGSMMVHGHVRSGSLFFYDNAVVADLPQMRFV